MGNKKCLVGATIIFKPRWTHRKVVLKDYGKVGKLVGVEEAWGEGRPLIVLKESTHISKVSSPRLFVTWRTSWRNVEVVKKNEQLLFFFMEQENDE